MLGRKEIQTKSCSLVLSFIFEGETVAIKETAFRFETVMCIYCLYFCFLTFEHIGTEIHWTFHKSAACLIKSSML